MSRASAALIAIVAFALSVASHAAEWIAAKPIRLILPYAPGGTTDLIARIVAGPLSSELGQQIVIDNRGGGGGLIAMSLIARAQPDGYTMGLPALSAHAANATLLQKSLGYDTEKDFTPVTFVGISPLVLVVNASNPAQSVEQLVARARETGKPVTFASGGIGLAAHIAGELVKLQSKGANMTHVPYKGGGPAITDLIAGHVPSFFAVISTAVPHVRSGKIRAIAVTGAKRAEALPEVPTVDESGVKGYAATNWYGMLAPAATPAPVIERLNRDMNAALRTSEVVAFLKDNGIEPAPGTPAEFARFIQAEQKKWTPIIKKSNIKVE